MRYLLIVFISLLSALAQADPAIDELKAYGIALGSNTENEAIKFEQVVKTTEKPLRAYKLTFLTNHEALMSLPNTAADKAAYLSNAGRTLVWQTKFCNVSLGPIFEKYGIQMIAGDLTNKDGKTQSMAVCFQSQKHKLSGTPLTYGH